MKFLRVVCLTAMAATLVALAPAPAMAARGLELSTHSMRFSRTGERHTVSVTNRADQPIRIFGVAVATASTLPQSGFALTEPLRPQTLASGEAASFTVEFRPPSLGASRQYFAALRLSTDDPSQPSDLQTKGSLVPTRHLTSVALRGSAVPPLLSMVVFLPLLGGLAALLLGRRRAAAGWAVALGAAGAAAVVALVSMVLFDPGLGVADLDGGVQLVEHTTLLRSLSVDYYLGVDGVSMALLVLTAVLGVVAVALSWADTTARGPRATAFLLVTESGLLGAAVAMDLGLLTVFWFVALLGGVLALAEGARGRRRAVVGKLALAAAASLILLTMATVEIGRATSQTYAVDGSPVQHILDMARLSQPSGFRPVGQVMGLSLPRVLWLQLFVAFGVFLPLVPLHGWLRDALTEASPGAAVLIGGVLSRFGLFGLLRVSWRLLPEPTQWAAGMVAVIAAVSMGYGVLAALAQRTTRGLAACSIIATGGAGLLGLASLTQAGLAGAVTLSWSHGLAIAMLVAVAHGFASRAGAEGFEAMQGVGSAMPRAAVMFGIASFAAAALPGTAGFVGLVLAVVGAFPAWRALAFAAAVLAVILAAAHLRPFARSFLVARSEVRREATGSDLGRRELAVVVPLAAVLLWLGFAPHPVLSGIATTVRGLLGNTLARPGTAGAIASLFQ